MSQSVYAAQAAVRRKSHVFTGLLGLFAAFFVGSICHDLLPDVRQRMLLFNMGTHVYRKAQWASTVSFFSFLCAGAALSVWLVSRFLRQSLGLPPRPQTGGTHRFFLLRVITAIPLMLWLIVWASDEFFVRHFTAAPLYALCLGMALCLMFAYDVPRLLRNGVSALCSRAPLLRVPFRELGALPASGRVHLRGTVASAGQTLPSLLGECVYRRGLSGGDEGTETVVAVPFLITAPGTQVFVDVDPRRLVVETQQGELWEAVLRVGARVHVIGTVVKSAGAYRGDARIGADPDGQMPLFLFSGRSTMNRRLVLAAAVELLAALGMLSCTTALLLFWGYTGYLARFGR